MTTRAILAVLMTAACCAAVQSDAESTRVAATIDASRTGEPITKYVYGHFIEHIGDLINGNLWAEMIDDRKFYYAVDSNPRDPEPPLGQVPARPGRRNHWRPIGPDSSVVMDRQRPYAGDQSPLVRLEGDEPRGIQQEGLALRADKGYTGTSGHRRGSPGPRCREPGMGARSG